MIKHSSYNTIVTKRYLWHHACLLITKDNHPSSLPRPFLLTPPVVPCREVSEPSTAAVTEVEPDPESSMAQQPDSGAEPENSEGRMEEVRSLRGWGCPVLLCLLLTFTLIYLNACLVKKVTQNQHNLNIVTLDLY